MADRKKAVPSLLTIPSSNPQSEFSESLSAPPDPSIPNVSTPSKLHPDGRRPFLTEDKFNPEFDIDLYEIIRVPFALLDDPALMMSPVWNGNRTEETNEYCSMVVMGISKGFHFDLTYMGNSYKIEGYLIRPCLSACRPSPQAHLIPFPSLQPLPESLFWPPIRTDYVSEKQEWLDVSQTWAVSIKPDSGIVRVFEPRIIMDETEMNRLYDYRRVKIEGLSPLPSTASSDRRWMDGLARTSTSKCVTTRQLDSGEEIEAERDLERRLEWASVDDNTRRHLLEERVNLWLRDVPPSLEDFLVEVPELDDWPAEQTPELDSILEALFAAERKTEFLYLDAMPQDAQPGHGPAFDDIIPTTTPDNFPNAPSTMTKDRNQSGRMHPRPSISATGTLEETDFFQYFGPPFPTPFGPSTISKPSPQKKLPHLSHELEKTIAPEFLPGPLFYNILHIPASHFSGLPPLLQNNTHCNLYVIKTHQGWSKELKCSILELTGYLIRPYDPETPGDNRVPLPSTQQAPVGHACRFHPPLKADYRTEEPEFFDLTKQYTALFKSREDYLYHFDPPAYIDADEERRLDKYRRVHVLGEEPIPSETSSDIRWMTPPTDLSSFKEWEPADTAEYLEWWRNFERAQEYMRIDDATRKKMLEEKVWAWLEGLANGSGDGSDVKTPEVDEWVVGEVLGVEVFVAEGTAEYGCLDEMLTGVPVVV
ncbi:hypothetical protein BJ508DRAFT_316030 [Ascobolus immersus RN42]|uniref:Uncharacterized protein n=1 Tax=Ascobolus immersus RN42 TaxID=1160509 RepID=A0A3N4H853_ASCIM|nr:hypothetical protein BJ508DRAFT_316030 [Ascobolus immersus RN42]